MNNQTAKPVTWEVRKIFEFLAEIETRFPVDQWVVSGIHIWPVLRIHLARQLNQFVIHASPNRKSKLIKTAFIKLTRLPLGLCRHFWAKWTDYKKNARPGKNVDVLFITYAQARRFVLNHGWFNVFCDPFIHLLSKRNLSHLTLEYSLPYQYKTPRYSSSRLIQPRLSFLAFLNGLTANRIQIPEPVQKGLNSLFDFLRSRGLDAYVVDDYFIKLQVGSLLRLARFYRKIIQKYKPSLVIGSNYYGIQEMAVNWVCHQLNIPCMDIQHGLQGEWHPAFGKWHKLPEKGFELMPTIFWNWGEEETKTIQQWNSSVTDYHFPIPGGNLMSYFFSSTNDATLAEFDQTIQRINPSGNEHKHNILISLQYNRGFPDIYRETILSAPPNYFWWIRFHPGMTDSEKLDVSTRVAEMKKDNVNVHEAGNLPLYSLLTHTGVHITEISSVVLEAEYFSVPSIITHPLGIPHYQKQLDSGIAIFADTCREILHGIETQLQKKKNMIQNTSNQTIEAFNNLWNYVENKKENDEGLVRDPKSLINF